MEALEFLKEERRMCASFDAMCVKCPLGDAGCCVIVGDTDRELENEVTTVEQWSKKHPRKTRQSEFLKQWPEANVDDYGVLKMCPCPISASHRNAHGGCANIGVKCSDCRREFWSQEVE
jgi:hypothetical protein|nr:MAG TPA: hypothetical protein [Caudoviricetes sp.]